jgi:hypothetical protein
MVLFQQCSSQALQEAWDENKTRTKNINSVILPDEVLNLIN